MQSGKTHDFIAWQLKTLIGQAQAQGHGVEFDEVLSPKGGYETQKYWHAHGQMVLGRWQKAIGDHLRGLIRTRFSGHG
jgi:hypothetical protein